MPGDTLDLTILSSGQDAVQEEIVKVVVPFIEVRGMYACSLCISVGWPVECDIHGAVGDGCA